MDLRDSGYAQQIAQYKSIAVALFDGLLVAASIANVMNSLQKQQYRIILRFYDFFKGGIYFFLTCAAVTCGYCRSLAPLLSPPSPT